jgi:PAS domain S-box-containing protein
MDDWRKRIADLVYTYFGTRGVSRSRVELFLRQLEPMMAGTDGELPLEVRQIISNLQTMTVLLRRGPDGEPIYVLREGRLAGALRTEVVRGKRPQDIFPPEVNAITLPMVARAFEGEDVEFTYTLDGRTYLTLLHPFSRDASGRVTEVLGSMVDVTTERQYAQQLEHNERLFRTLIENMPCGVLYEEFDRKTGKLSQVVINSEFTRVTGYTLETYDQFSDKDRIHQEDYPVVEEQFDRWLKTRNPTPLHLQYRFVDRYGVERWLDNYITRLDYEDGRVGLLQVVLDITERATAEQRLRHAASYLEQSIEPIIECDTAFMVTFINPAAYTAFPDLKVGASVLEHEVGQDLQAQIDHADAKQQLTITVKRKAYTRLVAQTERGWRLFCHDVTALVEAERALRIALEHEQTMNMLRSQFVSTLSHEFRTPLAGILTAAQLLDRYVAVMTDQQRKHTIDSIIARVRDLEYIVHSFTRRTALLGRTDAVMSEIDPNALIESISSGIEIIKRKGVTVTIESMVEAAIRVDAELLHAVVEAVLDNAARYGPDGGSILVQIGVRNSQRLCVTVRDYGVGIPEDEMDRLFMPYFRSSRTGNIPGSGLSLATLKPLVESVGGCIMLYNHISGGIVATVEMPCTLPAMNVKHVSVKAGEQTANNPSH